MGPIRTTLIFNQANPLIRGKKARLGFFPRPRLSLWAERWFPAEMTRERATSYNVFLADKNAFRKISKTERGAGGSPAGGFPAPFPGLHPPGSCCPVGPGAYFTFPFPFAAAFLAPANAATHWTGYKNSPAEPRKRERSYRRGKFQSAPRNG